MEFLLALALAIAGALTILLYGGMTWFWHRVDDNFDKRWWDDHQFCPVCGEHMEWVATPRVLHDEHTGEAYTSEVWSCPTPRHTFNDLIDRCVRRTSVA